jgi:hypothetical protein
VSVMWGDGGNRACRVCKNSFNLSDHTLAHTR